MTNGDRAADRVDALLEAVLAVSAGLDLDVTLRSIVDAALELVDARYGALGVVDPDGDLIDFVFTGIDEETRRLIGSHPTGKGLLGTVVRNGHTIRLDDLTVHRSFAGLPANHPPMRTFLGVPVRGHGSIVGRLYLTEKAGGRSFTAEDEVLVTSLAGAAGVAIDNARLYAQARDRQRWLEASADVTAVLLAGSETSDALHLIASRAREMTSADYTLVALPPAVPRPRDSSPPSDLVIAVAVGEEADGFAGHRIPIEGSTSGAVFADHVPRNVEGLSFSLEDATGVALGPALALPLGSGDAHGGVLLAVRKPGSTPFNDAELQVVSSFADQAALALQRAEVQTSRRELQALTERDRIATDLHDHVIQRLFAVAMAMEGTQRRVDAPLIALRLADHVDQLHKTILQIRSAIFDLRHEPAPPPSLRTTLSELVLGLTAGSPLTVTVRLAGDVDSVPSGVALQAESALRATVAEIVRDSAVTEMVVDVTLADNLRIEVTAGTRPEAAAPAGARPGDGRAPEGPEAVTGVRLRWSSAAL